MEEKILETLESIGMNKNEAKVYLYLSTNKPSLARDITKGTKIHKANTYEALKGLSSKGFIEEILRENKRLFVALNPKVILDYINKKEKEIKQIISILPTLSHKDSGEEELSLTKGIFSARNALLDLLKYQTEIYSYSIPSTTEEFFGTWFFEEFHKLRIKKKIPMRLIYDEELKDLFKKLNKLKHTQVLHSGFPTSTLSFITICNNTVLTIVLSNPVMVIKVTNKELANSYKDYFEVLWKNSKK